MTLEQAGALGAVETNVLEAAACAQALDDLAEMVDGQDGAVAIASFTSASFVFSGVITVLCTNPAMLDAEALDTDSILDWCSLLFSCCNRFDFCGYRDF